jgi:hypothetical protein
MDWASTLWGVRPRPAEPATPAPHRSLVLKALLDGLRRFQRPAVLDLGAPVGANLDLLSALSCRVSIADLHRLLAGEPGRRVAEPFPSLLERLLPAPQERFAAVLSWDLFNYMRRDQIQALTARLQPTLQAGAQLLAFVWTRPSIPAAPLRYRIVDDENVVGEGAREPARASPLYMQTDFARMMPGFAVSRSYLMRNGIQEYLFASGAT